MIKIYIERIAAGQGESVHVLRHRGTIKYL